MAKRFVSIWFPYLKTDWFTLRQPELKAKPFVLAIPDHGRLVISEANAWARHEGIYPSMALADARAVVPLLQVRDDKPGLSEKLLKGIAEWCIRFTPQTAIDNTDGLILDATGCAHLWSGEALYLDEITQRLTKLGYNTRAAIADTIGAAWAVCHYHDKFSIIEPGQQSAALQPLPAASLRLQQEVIQQLQKLGLQTVKDFINMPRVALRRRFGENLLQRVDQALGKERETIIPIVSPEPFEERLPCMDPIVNAGGIEIALKRLLHMMCARLQRQGKGLRNAALMCYRIDGKMVQIEIGTNKGNNNPTHLFKLFEFKIGDIEPALGIELFVLAATKVEELNAMQETMFIQRNGLNDKDVVELLDRISGKNGSACIRRYVPAEHYWPERSYREAKDINEQPVAVWNIGRPRPVLLLPNPEIIQVTASIPDYPPMTFRYKGKLHKVLRADGPERIEQEWWLQEGRHRDYYIVEDEAGCRYWIFRLGHYDAEKTYAWYMHGFFA